MIIETKPSVHLLFCKLQLESVQTTAEVCTDYTCSLHRLRRSLKIRKLSLHFIFTLTKTLVACSQNKDIEYISHNLSIMNTYSQFSVIRLNKYDLHN